MIVRKDVVQERLAFLRSTIRRLDLLRNVGREQFFTSEQFQWPAERGLQLAAQAVLDIGAHILTGRFNTRPADYEDVIRLMGEHRIIPDELRRRLTGLGGFRNVLVHGYLEIDVERLFEFLQRDSLAFRDYADAVEAWLAAPS